MTEINSSLNSDSAVLSSLSDKTVSFVLKYWQMKRMRLNPILVSLSWWAITISSTLPLMTRSRMEINPRLSKLNPDPISLMTL
jgi:hypothetical protein